MQNARWIYIFLFLASKQLHLAPRGHRFAQLIFEHAEQFVRSISHPSTVICEGYAGLLSSRSTIMIITPQRKDITPFIFVENTVFEVSRN